jgi:HPt (histidine-containing phosphotransfer) domain-containing protein
MRMLDELRRDGESLFDRASSNFAANATEHLVMIRRAVDSGDAAALVATAHRLNCSATNLGLPVLGAAAGALGAIGDSGTLGPRTVVDDLVAAMEQELEHALAALTELRAQGLGPGPEDGPGDLPR